MILDDIELRDYALRDPKGFIKYYSHPLIIEFLIRFIQLKYKTINPVSHNKRFTVLKKFKKNINIGLVIDSSDKVLPINDEVYYCPIDIIGL